MEKLQETPAFDGKKNMVSGSDCPTTNPFISWLVEVIPGGDEI